MKDGLLDQLAALQQQNAEIIKTIQAICRVVGAGEVQAELAAGTRAEQEQVVKAALEKGQLKKAVLASEDSFVVGVENQPDGQMVFPGRFQMGLKGLPEEHRTLFLGKKANDKVTLPNGSVATMTEIYDIVTAPKTKKVKAPKAKKAARPVVPPAPDAN